MKIAFKCSSEIWKYLWPRNLWHYHVTATKKCTNMRLITCHIGKVVRRLSPKNHDFQAKSALILTKKRFLALKLNWGPISIKDPTKSRTSKWDNFLTEIDSKILLEASVHWDFSNKPNMVFWLEPTNRLNNAKYTFCMIFLIPDNELILLDYHKNFNISSVFKKYFYS